MTIMPENIQNEKYNLIIILPIRYNENPVKVTGNLNKKYNFHLLKKE